MADISKKTETRNSVAEHPAVLAWSILQPGRTKPERIQVVRPFDASKVPVFRLVGVGDGGSSVIAKYCETTVAVTEHIIYRKILSATSLSIPHYYGFIEENAQSCWIFLEDVGGVPFSFQDARHTALAGMWLAELHTSVSIPDCLQDRGPNHYRSALRTARDTILLNLSNNALRDEDLVVLHSIVDQCDSLESRWNQVEGFCKAVPWGFVHGDFKTKNVRIRNDHEGDILFAFDWENAGWGLPGVDIWKLDAEPYWRIVRNHWHNVSLNTIHQLSNLGKLFRCLDAVGWEAQSLAFRWLDKPMSRMKVYEARLSLAIQAIF